MKIAMFTNTYLPHVGGVARSVSSFAAAYRKMGHECLIVAPEFEGEYEDEEYIHRVPATKNFNDSGFSVRIPFTGGVTEALDAFGPEIVHAHHPFLLGDSAMRSAYSRNLPLIFTHHTLYEQYTNYLPFHGEFTQRAAMEIATSFANTCSLVFAPSQSIAELIVKRGVDTEVVVQPTGIDLEYFKAGESKRFREKWKIAQDALVIGHVGRIATEKNIEFLMKACCDTLKGRSNARMLIVGSGDRSDVVMEIARAFGVEKQVVETGSLQGSDLADAYACIDVFAFASQSETQGLVLAEAMASGTAVVALEGPGVSDVVKNGYNGILLDPAASENAFAERLGNVIDDEKLRERLAEGAIETSREFSHEETARTAIEHYARTIEEFEDRIESTGIENFDKILASLDGEFELLKVKAATLSAAIGME